MFHYYVDTSISQTVDHISFSDKYNHNLRFTETQLSKRLLENVYGLIGMRT